MSDAVSLISDQESSHCSSIIIELCDKKSVKNCNSFTFLGQKFVCWWPSFLLLIFLALICVSTLKWLMIVDASWSILTHHDESEFELKNKMQFVAQHTFILYFTMYACKSFFLFQLCFWRNENKEINLISSALIKTCDYGAKVSTYVRIELLLC